MNNLYIGTCSWKYPSWKGLVYSKAKPENYLKEYALKFNTVEVDQWFWSLFGDSVVLPKVNVVEEYAKSAPESFKFAVKAPNAVTLTHHYQKGKKSPAVINSHFFSPGVMNRFLESLEPIHKNLGPVMLQFEYLNKQKMSGQGEFLNKLGKFIDKLPKGFSYAVEIRNPNYLNKTYFKAINDLELTHVFLQGYYMPPISEIFNKHQEMFTKDLIVRLHGPDRQDIEEKTNKKWHEIVAPKDDEIDQVVSILNAVKENKYIYVNNHFEGSAPRTIEKIRDSLQ